MTHRGFGEVNAALQVSDERYRELFETANDVVFTTDLEGNFTSINRAGERLTGYHRSEALSKNFTTVIPPECWDVVRRARDAKLSGKDENTQYEIQMCTKDGRRIPMEVSTRLIHRGGRPVGIQGIARDITERKMAEQAMRWLNEQLEEGIKRIAHALHDEAAQLLAAVYLTVEDIACRLPPEQREPLKRIHLPLDHAAGQLRRLSHELRPVILDDLGLFPALQFLTQGISQRTGLAITIDGWAQERLAPVVEIALYRILQEALTNVSKHAQATRVTVRLQREAETIACTIRDDGVGFELTGAGATRERPGLGLIGIRERLAVLGGTLSITTRPGRGTTLDMRIPLET
jgi:PAS domain S-box-containing protein